MRRMRSPSVGLSEFDFEEDEGEDEDGALALTLAAQQLSPEAEPETDMSQYLLMQAIERRRPRQSAHPDAVPAAGRQKGQHGRRWTVLDFPTFAQGRGGGRV
ncbi:unnamed protein product [Tilletia controversa]|uniref:Uncharacterized protein n=1 Tax=Tilletia caries TaxID=13290 RepID=A0ABN7IZE9_9BASI|nr:unnamed protein product [Tilletia controversa]CAD6940667.1 unnamed protein product [Tilletia caries]